MWKHYTQRTSNSVVQHHIRFYPSWHMAVVGQTSLLPVIIIGFVLVNGCKTSSAAENSSTDFIFLLVFSFHLFSTAKSRRIPELSLDFVFVANIICIVSNSVDNFIFDSHAWFNCPLIVNGIFLDEKKSKTKQNQKYVARDSEVIESENWIFLLNWLWIDHVILFELCKI